MKVELADIGKRFNREWIFRKLNLVLESGTICGFIGPNGSGKSTLLRLIAQAELPSEGKVNYYDDQQEPVVAEQAYEKISFAAPYIDLPEQLSLKEFFHFHCTFSPLKEGIGLNEFLKIVFLENAKDKQIANFSSGMKQRLKLGICLLSRSPLIILDEPCSNLDGAGMELYQNLLKTNSKDRLILIGSNELEKELFSANQFVSLSDYKI